MEANIVWKDGVTFTARSGSGHEITIDGPPESGGRNAGARPMELMLLGLGGCAAFDVVHILRKSRSAVSRCEARVTANRAESDPKVFTDVHLHFTVAGENLTEKKVARAVELSAEKYCSASIMLRRAGVAVTHGFELA
ncbi:MAG: OsmC family protein [Rhodospirillales bacterium]|nr:OsmC family protein [Rhodospirillales bacterium]